MCVLNLNLNVNPGHLQVLRLWTWRALFINEVCTNHTQFGEVSLKQLPRWPQNEQIQNLFVFKTYRHPVHVSRSWLYFQRVRAAGRWVATDWNMSEKLMKIKTRANWGYPQTGPVSLMKEAVPSSLLTQFYQDMFVASPLWRFSSGIYTI